MNELMDVTTAANNELTTIVKMVHTLQEKMNEKVKSQEDSYDKIKETIQDYLNKISKNIPIDEEDLNAFLSDNSEYNAIISLTKTLDDKIFIVDQVRDALKVNELANSLSNNAQIKAGQSIEDPDLVNLDDDENNNNRYRYQVETRRKRKRKAEDDDESFTLSDRDKDNHSEGEDEDEAYNDDYPNIICKRKRRPLFFCNNSIKMDKYAILSTKPFLSNPRICEESSDFFSCSVTLDQMDKLPELTKEKEALMPLVLNDIQSYATKYLIDNFDKLMHVRTLYYCYYDMQDNPPECNYEYFPFDKKIIHGLNDFKYVKLILVRKPGGKIQNVILGCANLFISQLSRKDIDGNTLIKGELKVSFDTFQFYFLTGIKGFSHLSQVQIEVFLHRNELFEDYNNVIDKSNLKAEQLRRYALMGERLMRLRTVDRKIKLLELHTKTG